MCGIVGYVGNRNCSDVLVDTLSKLEYRGYDSAGIAVFEHNKRSDLNKTADTHNIDHIHRCHDQVRIIGVYPQKKFRKHCVLNQKRHNHGKGKNLVFTDQTPYL